MSDWNEWDCHQAEGSVVYISNEAKKLGNHGNYVIGCEAEVLGYPVS